MIFGLNGFYDYIESMEGNHFDQAGLGAEVLTHYVDARFNYYLPDNSSYIVDTRTHTSSHSSSRLGTANGFFTRETTTTTSFTEQQRVEVGLEGFYTEAGVLVPGLDKYFEMRLFAGYYHYNNPFGRDFRGFEARAEARLLPGVITRCFGLPTTSTSSARIGSRAFARRCLLKLEISSVEKIRSRARPRHSSLDGSVISTSAWARW